MSNTSFFMKLTTTYTMKSFSPLRLGCRPTLNVVNSTKRLKLNGEQTRSTNGSVSVSEVNNKLSLKRWVMRTDSQRSCCGGRVAHSKYYRYCTYWRHSRPYRVHIWDLVACPRIVSRVNRGFVLKLPLCYEIAFSNVNFIDWLQYSCIVLCLSVTLISTIKI